MAAGQQWLFAPATPLVERLGRKFFRQAPEKPGVYLMRDASGEVVYVGKAKNLRRRLRSYRVANPEHMTRRHLRLVREVTRIDFNLCHHESAALAREAGLLRRLKPKFNRAGVWPGKARFVTWRFADETVQLSVDEVPPLGWERFGTLGGYAPRLHGAVVRLLWLALNPQAGFSQLPHGWTSTRLPLPVTIGCGARIREIRSALENVFWGKPGAFTDWLMATVATRLPAFDRAAVLADLEEINYFTASYRGSKSDSAQLALL